MVHLEKLACIPHSCSVERSQIVLRRGLAAKDLDGMLKSFTRQTDLGHRGLAFYLADMSERRLFRLFGCVSTAHYARDHLDMGERLARELVAVGRALEELTLIDAAFAENQISWTKVRLLCRIATPETERAWLDRALLLTTRRLEREVTGSERGRLPNADGKGLPEVRVIRRFHLSPLVEELWVNVVNLLSERAGAALKDEDVFRLVMESALHEGVAERASDVYKVVVHRCPTCRQHEIPTADGPVPLAAADGEALSCGARPADAEKADGEVLPLPTPPALRRRILARDGHRCRNCGLKTSLHAHHIRPRSEGGPTTPRNLVTLCTSCHALVHGGCLEIEGEAPSNLRIRAVLTANDRDSADATPRPRVPDIVADVRERGTRVPRLVAPAPKAKARPALADLVGQDRIRKSLSCSVRAARNENRPLPHILLTGGPGLGKTRLACALATEMKSDFHRTAAPLLTKTSDLVRLLTRLRNGDVLFIDEIHALPRPVAEVLYEAMEEGRLSLPDGPPLDLPPFTVPGATTDPELLAKPFRDRFPRLEILDPYSTGELEEILRRRAASLATEITPLAVHGMARACQGVPRRAIGLLTVARDVAMARACRRIEEKDVREALEGQGIDGDGLDLNQRRALEILRSHAGFSIAMPSSMGYV
ncbi:MAG TPA: AAA family ATPase [Planctomycetes bacterium]|nr:AAA family ATPase [Planctomycetota bacterium]